MNIIRTHGRPFPYYSPIVYRTNQGTPFLNEVGLSLLTQPLTSRENLHPFLNEFDEELGFDDYFTDREIDEEGTEIVKMAGQLCYMSFGKARSTNSPEDVEKYLGNILSSKHGSVLEHANFSILFWGDSRSLTHELVRHRVGVGYSQVSQRYVDGAKLRFVKRPEYQNDERLGLMFEERIDRARNEYDAISSRLMEITKFSDDMTKTERRKAVNQAARSCLPNETEAPIIVTANMRTWRHMIEQRASRHAEPEIRRGFVKVLHTLAIVAGSLVNDYDVTTLADNSSEVTTEWRKV